MKSTKREPQPSHLSLASSDGSGHRMRPALDFSQLAKFATDVIALNAQGVCGTTPSDELKKEFKPAALASFKSGLIVRKLSPEADLEPPRVIPIRSARKE